VVFLWPLLAITFTIQEPSTPAEAPARITLRRTPCFGECPDYTVTIDRDGTVAYDGRRFVRVTGRQTARISAAAVKALLDEFQQIDFFSLKDRYNAPVTDLPTTYVTLRLGERSKTVEDYVGAPKPLRDLERHIDEAAGVQRWIRTDTATVKDLVRSGSRANGDEGRLALPSITTTPSAQSAARLRVVAMGDSTTAGTPAFTSPREAPPSGSGDETSQYAYWLMKAHPDWEVINQGINAQRSDQIHGRFEEDVVAKKPAVVVIVAGVNDVYQGRGVDHVKTELAAMYKRAKDAGIKVVAGSIIPYNTATADQNARMHAINDWIRAQPKVDPNVRFVDTRAAVAAPGNADRLVSSPDGLHPDAAGYRKMAEAIERVIIEWLKA